MTLRLLVGCKRVVDYAVKIKVKADMTGVETNGVKHSMNPFDEIAVEEAVRMKTANIAKDIIACSVGPQKSQEVLRYALAMGATSAIHVQVDTKSELDLQPLLIAKIFKKIVEKENIDLVLLGKQSIDDDSNQTGQLLAGLLDWPQITFASKLTFKDKVMEASREIDGGIESLKTKLPAVITTDLRLNEPRYASLPNIMKAKKKPLTKLTPKDLGVEIEQRIDYLEVREPPKRQGGAKVESVDELIEKLRNEAKVI